MRGSHADECALGIFKGAERAEGHHAILHMEQAGGIVHAEAGEAGYLALYGRAGGLFVLQAHEELMPVGKQAAALVSHDFYGHSGHALALHLQAGGRGEGKIDDTPPLVRAAVVDAHDEAFADVLASDFDQRAQRYGLVGGRHDEHIVGFAAGRHLPMVSCLVPRGRTGQGEDSPPMSLRRDKQEAERQPCAGRQDTKEKYRHTDSGSGEEHATEALWSELK